MKNSLPTIPTSLAIGFALLLSSCGKQEAVGDVPSSEELAKQADAATAAIRDEEAAAAAEESGTPALVDSAEMTSYTNTLRGYTILLPKGWAQDEDASDDNGRVYKSADASLTVGWIENREDADFKSAVEAIENIGETMSGSNVSENEYRANGSSGENEQLAQRIMRKPDGTMISAKITYPTDQASKLDGVSKQILDSLTLQ